MFTPINHKTGETFQLSWHYKLLRISAAWPLKDDNKWIVIFLYNFIAFCCMVVFTAFLVSAVFYIFKETDLNYQLQCIIICVAIFSGQFRILNFIYRRKDFKNLLNIFFFEIYIKKKEKGSTLVKFMLRPIDLMCMSYNFSFLWFTVQPTLSYYVLGFETEPLPNRIMNFYNIRGKLNIGLSYCAVTWVTMSTATLFAVESYLIGFYMAHMVGRFQNLHDDILNVFNDINGNDILKKTNVRVQNERFLNNRLKDLIERHKELKIFGNMLNSNFSFRYFVTVLSSGILLCLVVFIIQEGSGRVINFMFVLWAGAAIIEQLAVGYIGSELIDLDERISSAFYSCNWENVLLNPQISYYQKKLLLGDLLTAMNICAATKPIKITGLNFFDLSIVTAFNTVRTGISYFMFLNTMKNAEG